MIKITCKSANYVAYMIVPFTHTHTHTHTPLYFLCENTVCDTADPNHLTGMLCFNIQHVTQNKKQRILNTT